jgi:hypothetical protein
MMLKASSRERNEARLAQQRQLLTTACSCLGTSELPIQRYIHELVWNELLEPVWNGLLDLCSDRMAIAIVEYFEPATSV